MSDDEGAQDPSPQASPQTERSLPLTPAGELGLVGRGLSYEEQVEILDQLFYEDDRRGPYLLRFAVLMVFSAAIAALGLLGDSGAVVIGAMLIAPLMTPLLATGASLVQGWVARLWESIAIAALGAVLGFATGWVVSLVFGSTTTAAALPDELLARTSPSIVDLAIAAAAGGAGGWILLRKEASAALPGVGIAVALVPPIAAAGVLYQLDEPDLGRGALLLFATNLATIVLSAAIVYLAAGFVPRDVLVVKRRQVRLGLVVVALLVIVVAVPLTFHTVELVEDDRLKRLVRDVVPEWDATVEVVELDADGESGRIVVDIAVVGPAQPAPAWRLAELIHDRDGRQAEVQVSFTQRIDDAATAL